MYISINSAPVDITAEFFRRNRAFLATLNDLIFLANISDKKSIRPISSYFLAVRQSFCISSYCFCSWDNTFIKISETSTQLESISSIYENDNFSSLKIR